MAAATRRACAAVGARITTPAQIGKSCQRLSSATALASMVQSDMQVSLSDEKGIRACGPSFGTAPRACHGPRLLRMREALDILRSEECRVGTVSVRSCSY